MEIVITKSWRKSISMRFDAEGNLQVKAPKLSSQWTIDSFIAKNQAWIDKHAARIQKQRQDKKWYLFGEEIYPSNSPFSWGEWSLISPDKERIERGFKSQAKQYIPDRCQELADLHWFTYNTLRITSAMTRWGSCSSKKNINFSYRLIMSPKEAIDYVIIHELCHLRQMNHGPKFWKEVADIMPDYKVQEKHLKNEGWRYKV